MNRKTAWVIGLVLGMGCWLRPTAAQDVLPAAPDGGIKPTAFMRAVQPLAEVERMELAPIDLQAVRDEDVSREADGLAPRFAIPHEVYITPGTHGTWEELDSSTMLWRLRIAAPGAASINLGFTRYTMPAGGRLYLYAVDGSFTIRPFTAADNAPHGELWTPVCMSDDVMVELTIPTAQMSDLRLELGFINYGYRGFAGLRRNSKDDGGTPRSGSCNIDVVCPQGDPWRMEIPAVAVISTGGILFCTGFMVNDTSNDLRNFFMTADHCSVTANNAASLVCYWNYYNSWCRPPGSPESGLAGDGILTQFNSGATFRAAAADSDFTLVELNADPDPSWNISYAGWDRSDQFPATGSCIHHPNCQEKRITFFDSLHHPSHGSSWGCSPYPGPGDGTHIRVYWSAADGAVTEPGSSGSPLFDSNHRVIGQLHGGSSYCGATGDSLSDCYGRIFKSWTGGGSRSTRLSDWLDAAGTGAIAVNTVSWATLCSDAGTISLDRAKYACDGIVNVEVVDCGLNVDPNAIDTATIMVSSTTQPGGVSVELTEVMPNSGRLRGAVELSTVGSPGALQVSASDTITATYIDADNGAGGTNITVTATATMDCIPPIISNVQTVSVTGNDAVISFTANEAVQGTVFYGPSCGSLPGKATTAGYSTSVTVHVTDLADGTLYFYKVSAEDAAGNTVTDDNSGACYSFVTPQMPHYFTQLFTTDNDLDNFGLTFTPGAPYGFYNGCAQVISSLPTDPAEGTVLTLADDSFSQVTLTGGQTVKLYGVSYSTFYVGSNGYITFTGGDSTYAETLPAHFSQPRLSALFDDLDPSLGGTVSWRQLDDRVAVTWWGIAHAGTSNPNTFQIEMFYDGKITLDYMDLADTGGLAGLSAGGGQPSNYVSMNLSAMGLCGPKPPLATNVNVASPVSAGVSVALSAWDDGLPNPPAALSYIITMLPAHGGLADPNGGAIAAVPYTLLGGGKQVTYLPLPEYRPLDMFKFKANDGGTSPDGGDSNEATVMVDIGGSAYDPVAHDVSQAVPASKVANITLNGTDPNNDPLTYIIGSLPAAGKGLLFDPNGGKITGAPYTLLNGGKVVRYAPPFNQSVSASFTYSVKDATATSNTAAVSVTADTAAPQVVHDFSLDTNPGWSTTGSWAFGHPTGAGTHNHDPSNGYTGTNVYGYNLSGDYTKSMPVRYLTTTAMNCGNVTGVQLKFRRWLGVDLAPYARATVEVSSNGTNWTTVWQNTSGAAISESAWSLQSYDLSAVADNHATVYVRWGMGPTTADASVYPGWNIDDVQIWGVAHNSCAGVVPGDMNGDGVVNGLDVQRFTDMMINPYAPGAQFSEFCAADMNVDGFMGVEDLEAFVNTLLGP